MFNKTIAIMGASVAALLVSSTVMAQEAVTTDIDWTKGSPRYTSSDGQFQFRIRGRYMMDAYATDANITGTALDASNSGFATRRARLGVEGKLNQVFSFKAEYQFRAGNQPEFNDVWLGYDNNGLELIAGINYFTSSMDGLTSSLTHMTNERALVTNGFGQASRAIGFVARKYSDNWMVVGGLYGDAAENGEIALAPNTAQEGRYGQIRGAWALSNVRGNYLVIGASARKRDRNNQTISYSARAAQSNYAPSYFTAPTALQDTTFGLEGYWTHGSLSVLSEYQITKTDAFINTTTPVAKVDLKGGFVEVSYFLTGETRGYDVKEGTLKAVKPNSPFQEGGYGAWGLVARYDTLDYSDFVSSGIKGTEAKAITAGVFWQPTDYVVLRAMYGSTKYDRTNLAGRPDGTVNAFTFRTQFSF